MLQWNRNASQTCFENKIPPAGRAKLNQGGDFLPLGQKMENYRRTAPGSNYGKINNRIWKLSNNQRVLHLSPPRIPLGKPFHASSWVAKQAADAQSVAAATHKRVYLAEERRQRLCRPISTVTPTAVWNCECNSLNTGMDGGRGGALYGKNCSFISWLLSSSPPSPRA